MDAFWKSPGGDKPPFGCFQKLVNNGIFTISTGSLGRGDNFKRHTLSPINHGRGEITSILARKFHVGHTPMASTDTMIFVGRKGESPVASFGFFWEKKHKSMHDLARHETLHSCYAVVGRFDWRSLQSGFDRLCQ